MTEAEWVASADPAAMLSFLTRRNAAPVGHRTVPPNGLVTDRKLRLWACAVCRQVWDGKECGRCDGAGRFRPLDLEDEEPDVTCAACHGTGRVGGLTDPRSRRAVEVAEWYADGEATKDELADAYRGLQASPRNGIDLAVRWACTTGSTAIHAAERVSVELGNPGHVPPATQAALLRCVFGNPFPRPYCHTHGSVPPSEVYKAEGEGCGHSDCWQEVTFRMLSKKYHQGRGEHAGVPPHVLRWNDGTVRRAAAGIYEDRRWGDLPILADALLDAGCEDEELIGHCREAGPHARGCAVVDLILGKE